jgi:putative ABC transport system permease protein
MAWRNIWRNPRRTILTAAAVAFACTVLIFMLSFQFGVYATMINSTVKIQSGHLQIMAKGYKDKMAMRYTIAAPQRIGKILGTMPDVTAYTYRAEAFSLVSSKAQTYGVLVTGIDPAKEKQVSTIKSLIREGRYLSNDTANEALIGQLLADNLKVKVGDNLTIIGQAKDGSIAATVVKVHGIFATGLDDLDRSTIELPLKTFQTVYAMGNSVHRVVVLVKSLLDVAPIKSALTSKLAGLNNRYGFRAYDWMQIMPGLLQSIKIDLASGLIMYAILIIVVAFSIMNTFLMAIFERTREFGVLMAIGTTPGRITKLLMMESSSMTAIGVVTGMLLGSLITLYFQQHGINVTGASEMLSQFGVSGLIYPQLSLLSLAIGPLAVLLITSLAALYPTLKIRRLIPVQALSYN